MTPDATTGRRVRFVIHSFDRGGSGRVAGHLARGFSDAGLDVGIVAFRRGGEIEADVEAIAGAGVDFSYLGGSPGIRPLDLAVGLPRLVGFLRRERPDVVIAAANNVALPTALAFRLAGLPDARLYLKTTNPVAHSRHRGPAAALRRLGYRLAFTRADGVWALSSDETAELVRAFPRHAGRFRPVANPYVTPDMLGTADGRPDRSRIGRRVVAVARLEPQKRLHLLIKAFAQVRVPDAELVILGEGSERPRLEALVRTLRVGHRVSLPGHVLDVGSILRASDLMVMTSQYEGLPAAVLEAMAANCPVLSTDCFPAAQSLLADAEGCAVIADTAPEPLARQIEDALRQVRPDGLRDVAKRYTIEAGVASHLAAIDEQRSGAVPSMRTGRESDAVPDRRPMR